MDSYYKKRVHHFWRLIRPVKPSYLFLAVLIMLGVSVVALRQNNQGMVERRQAVYQADEKNGDVEGALRELREYVHAHMNTGLSSGQNSVYPPIQLKYTYERLLAKENEQARALNQRIYTDAQAHCERLYPESFSGGPRVPCIQEYVSERGVKVRAIPDGLYKFDFVSPRWSPDLAGWSLVLTAILALLFLVRLALQPLLKRLDVL